MKSMKCTHPLYMLDLGLNMETGKRLLKMAPLRADISSLQSLEEKYGHNKVIPVPCGKCLACRISYSQNWSVRCMLEASLYDDNYFLTLTYDDEHLPKQVLKKDLQDFIKRLRHYIHGVRFFGCGEYGETTHRPHYHVILFNCNIPDLKCISKGRSGGFYYSSNLIESIWSKGQITIGDVSLASCEYVARYVVKKINSPFKDEFVLMSLKPGIGAEYFNQHYESIYETDGVYVKGRKLSVPRYFDKLLERIDPGMFKAIKYERLSKSSSFRVAELVDRQVRFDEELYSINEQINLDKLRDKLKKGVL